MGSSHLFEEGLRWMTEIFGILTETLDFSEFDAHFSIIFNVFNNKLFPNSL